MAHIASLPSQSDGAAQQTTVQCERSVTVMVRDGLHARPATQFVKLARTFRSKLEVLREGQGADAKSAVKLMLLAVKEEDRIVIRGEGDDALMAVESLARFVSDPGAGLEVRAAAETQPGPPDAATSDPAAAGSGRPEALDRNRRGVPASPGAALGDAFPFFPAKLVAEPRRLRTR